jgi:hypothetical protein
MGTVHTPAGSCKFVVATRGLHELDSLVITMPDTTVGLCHMVLSMASLPRAAEDRLLVRGGGCDRIRVILRGVGGNSIMFPLGITGLGFWCQLMAGEYYMSYRDCLALRIEVTLVNFRRTVRDI